MKQKWYRSNVTKAVLVILAHIMIIVMTASSMWIISYPTLREELFAGEKARKYEDTRHFVEEMQNLSHQAVAGIGTKAIFETDGKYNPDKIIDIEQYFFDNSVSGKNESGFAYRLEDLLSWYEYLQNSGDGAEEDDITDQIIVCKKADGTYHYYLLAEFYDRIQSGKLKFVLSEEDEGITEGGILSDLQEGLDIPEGMYRGLQGKDGKIKYTDFWLYDGIYMPELYSPVGEESLLNLVNENPQWNGRLDEAFRMLNGTIYTFGEIKNDYESINSGIEEGDTNFFYIYADTVTKRIYTNRSEYRKYAQLDDSIEKMKASGKYIIVKPKLVDFETNLKDVDASAWRDSILATGLSEQDFLFVAVVDTKYPVQDGFYSEDRLYDKYGRNAKQIAVLAVLALVVFLGCVLWLSAVAGRSSKDSELHLNWFDYWKTELAAGFVVILWMLPIMFVISVVGDVGNYIASRTVEVFQASSSSSYLANSIPYIILGCLMSGYTCCMFLVGLLSLVRRLKAKTVWKNSVLKKALEFAVLLFKNVNCIWKTILLFGGFLVLQWITLIRYGNLSDISMLVMFLVETAAFIYMVFKAIGRNRIKKGIKMISAGEVEYKIPLDKLYGDQKEIAEDVNSIGAGLDAALEKSMKSERLKTDLITNVSHDIKTPLTSIINYVELLKQEHFEDPKVQRYIEVLEQKSQRLKNLTEDVVEASKVSSGNISLEFINLNFTELLQQVSGEFKEKFEARNLQEVLILPQEQVVIRADGRRTWRILENIYNNAAKYAMEGTRIYAELSVTKDKAVFNLKNISKQALNISADELTERFIRGDISRSTEGSGLGLSIAKSLATMQGGTFDLYLDGDLFKVTITFPRVSHS